MKSLVGNSLRVLVGAFVVYSCAGKSISRTEEDDDPPPTADDGGFTGGRPGAGGSVIGGFGGTTGLGGTTTGKGGVGTGGTIGTGGVPGKGGSPGRGGTAGKGGTAGRGGTAGKGGIGGTGGSNIAGEDAGGVGPGGSDCGPSRESTMQSANCSLSPSCITPNNPVLDNIGRNEITGVGGIDGGGGEGGSDGDDGDYVASAVLCGQSWNDGFLAFDYYTPEGYPADAQFSLYSGDRLCSGFFIGYSSFSDYALPPEGTWTAQCIAVRDIDLDNVVSIAVPIGVRPWARVKNLRFVSSCSCPRQFTTYTTCGAITSPRYCR